MKVRFLALAFLLGWSGTQLLRAQTSASRTRDSLSLESVSSEDLLKLKEELEGHKTKLDVERLNLLDKGIKQSKDYLEKSNSSATTSALILLQRAEYIYAVMADKFLVASDSVARENAIIVAEYDRKKEELRDKMIAERKSDKEIEQAMNELPRVETLPDPEQDYSEVIKTYQQLMDNFPESQYVIDAMYNIAFFRESEGKDLRSRGDDRSNAEADRKQREALKIYQDLAVRFPDSKYASECYNRIGEYYFLRGGDADLQKAIKNYSKVLDYPQSERFPEAVYKLAWTYYRLGNYPQAISYFTYLVDDVDSARFYNNNTPELDGEALINIGICFNRWAEQIDLAQGTNEGGHKLIKAYIDEAKLTNKRFAPEIIWQLAESYNLEQRDTLALDAYKVMLASYPLFWRSPDAQYNIISTFDRLQRGSQNPKTAKALLDSVINNRFKLYEAYKPGSAWSLANEDKELVNRANRMARDVLVDNILYYYGEAGYSNDLGDWKLAMDYSRQFITYFPVDTFAYKFHYNMAWIQYNLFGILDSSYEDFIKVATLYPYDQFRYSAAMNAYSIADSIYRRKTFQKPQNVPMDSILPLTAGESKLLDAINAFARLFPDTVTKYPVDSLQNPKPVLGVPGYKTPDFLAYAGAIYYTHNNFNRASQYFNTIVTRYPKSDKARLSQRYLMVTYRDRKDFRSSEIVARKLIESPEATAEQKSEAVTTVFYSIFKHAEFFQGKKESYKAAREFQRAYEDGQKLGYTKRAELGVALYNSGVEYYGSKELKRSIKSFEAFADSFPNEKLAPTALSNIQNTYADMKEMMTAATYGERLSDKYPNYADGPTRSSEIALYNSEYYYEQAAKQSIAKGDSNAGKDLNKQAIRISEKFVQRYPKSQYTSEIDFNIAKLYFAVNEEERGYQKYTQYAKVYPNDKRNVQALYDVGINHLRRNRRSDAITSLKEAKKKSDDLKSLRLDYNKYFSSEAVFELAKLRYEDFSKIKLKEPNITQKEDQKLAIVQDLMTYYESITSYAQIRTYEAAYYRGLVREEFGDALANREFKQEKDIVKMVKAQTESFYGAAQVYKSAVQEYIGASDFLDKVYKKLSDDEKDIADSINKVYAKKPDSAAVIIKGLIEGRTAKEKEFSLAKQKEQALQYRDLAKSKISRILYAVANAKRLVLEIYQNAPIDFKPGTLEYLESQRGLLDKAVLPSAIDAIKAFEDAAKQMDSLGINDKYTAECRRNMVRFAAIVPSEYAKMAFSVMQQYKIHSDEYREIVRKGDTYVDKKTGKDFYTIFYEIPAEMQAYITVYAKPFGETALKGYAAAVKQAKAKGLFDEDARQIQREMFAFAYDFAKLNYAESDTADKYYKSYEATYFQNQGDDAYAFYTDASQTYSQNLTFARENAKGVLEEAYSNAIELGLASEEADPAGGPKDKIAKTDNPELRKILALLGKYDQYYAKLLKLKSYTNFFASNYSDWYSSTRYYDSWQTNGFNDKVWYNAAPPQSPIIVGHKVLQEHESYPIWAGMGQSFTPPNLSNAIEPPAPPVEATFPTVDSTKKAVPDSASGSTSPDSAASAPVETDTSKTKSFVTRRMELTDFIVQDSVSRPVFTQDQITKTLDTAKVVYYRTNFDVKGSPQAGKLYVAVDGYYEFYLNGVFVGTALQESGEDDDSTYVLETTELSLDNFVQGRNVLAIVQTDRDSPKEHRGIRVVLEVSEVEDPTVGIQEAALPSTDELRGIMFRRGRVVKN